ncbi:YppF family protein [Niallia endozanthoxylica]|uniref:YppF-like protein n=1 Tax=Niallia endozanthoxylica TaxID=2036016 RepID=A0A5J5H102_9BACI|nr:YppF family protein [Niallia endozanthoxylica]KAA9014215.1 hypothetical protein F4V44_24180 [Niallia endozanthoxylica]
MLEELKSHFEKVKNRNPLHVNELLDHIQRRYIHGELSIVEYKQFYSVLDKLNAQKPDSFIFASNS